MRLREKAVRITTLNSPDQPDPIRIPPHEVDVDVRPHERAAGYPREVPPLESPSEAGKLSVAVVPERREKVRTRNMELLQRIESKNVPRQHLGSELLLVAKLCVYSFPSGQLLVRKKGSTR